MGRIKSTIAAIAQNWGNTQRVYRTLPLEVLGFFLAGFAVGFSIVFFVLRAVPAVAVTASVIGVLTGVLAGLFWFGRRAMSASYKLIEGQMGAAAGVAQSIKRGWACTPAVAVSPQAMVTRMVGKPGVVLVGEGPAARLRPLMANERKKTARWVPEVPIYEIQVGEDDGQIALDRLQRSLSRLPRALRGGEITEIRRRLDAVSHTGGGMPIPKGPMPTSTRQVRRQR